MSVLKKLAGQTAVYGLSSILGRVINYLLVPFYTSIFLPSEYGIVTELYAYIAFLNVVYTFGMETTFFRFATKEKERIQEYFNRAGTFLVILSGTFSGLIVLFSQPISTWLQYPQHSNLITWTALILATDTLSAIPFARLRLENKAFLFAMLKLANIIINVGLNLLFLLAIPELMAKILPVSHPVAYVFLANLIANGITLILLLPRLNKFRLDWNIQNFKPMFIYGWPIMAAGLAGMINEVIDRILLKHLLPANFYDGHDSLWAVGVYGACYKLSIFMSLAIQSYRFAAEPFFFSQSENKNASETYAKAMRWFIIVCCFMFLVLSLNLDLLELLLINKQYREGILIVPVLLLANLFLGIYFNLSIWYKLSDKTYWGALISAFGAVLTIGLNFWLIPTEGYFGAAWATLACYGGMAVVSYFIGQKYYPIKYDLSSAIVHLGLATLTVYVYIEFPKMELLYAHWIKAAIILQYLLLVIWFDKIKIPFNRLKNKFS